MVRDPTEAEELLADSRTAVETLSRLIGRLEAFTGKLVHELDLRKEEGDSDGKR